MPDESKAQAARLNEMRQKRAAAFRSEVFPYFRYVVQSGFGLAAGASLFMLAIAYASLLEDIPPDAPIGSAGAAVIALAAAWSPLRTYLTAADAVFWLPMETSVLREYLRPLLRRTAFAGMVRTLAVFLLFVPLYGKAPDTAAAAASRPLWLLGTAVVSLAVWNAWGAWRERLTAFSGPRWLLRLSRWGLTLLAAWALINAAAAPAFAFAAGAMALQAALWKLPRRHALPWDKLIREEAAARRRWQRFLGWFVHTPSMESRPSRRRWAAWPGDLLPWHSRWTWHYLYAKIFARSDTLGALTWWHAVVVFVVLALDDPSADWVAYGIGVAVSGMQLLELPSHRLPLPAETLPPDPGKQPVAAAAVARTAGMAGAALMWLPAALPQDGPPSGTACFMLAAGLLWSGWLIPRRLVRANEPI